MTAAKQGFLAMNDVTMDFGSLAYYVISNGIEKEVSDTGRGNRGGMLVP